MKLHLPLSLLHAVLCAVCSFTFGTATLVGGAMALAAPCSQAASFSESNHHVELTSATNGGIILSELGAALTLDGLSSVRLSNNEIISSKKVYGGVICNYSAGNSDTLVLTMTDNDNITFSGNTVSISAKNVNVQGGVLYNGRSYANTESYANISGNGDVSFTDNAMVLYDGGYGGAIYNLTGTHKLQLNENESLTFSGNSIRAQAAAGGAIFSEGEAEIMGNGSLKFLNNGIDGRVTASYVGDAQGGAIYIANQGTKESLSGNTFTYGLTIAKNSAVEFSGNYLISANSNTDMYGGAISATNSVLTITQNGDISMNGNYISGTGRYLRGGALFSSSAGVVSFTNNGNISFSGNFVNSADGATATSGGAISLSYSNNHTRETFDMSGNKAISFVENYVTGLKYVEGGAFYNRGKAVCICNNNGDITFARNEATSTGASAGGGALLNDINVSGPISITGNHDIVVIGNKATGATTAFGGAFYLVNGEQVFDCNDNRNILFSGNMAIAGSESARGGALYAFRSKYVNFLGNSGAITFEDNVARSTSGDAEGGAIHGDTYGDGNCYLDMQLADGIVFTSNKAQTETGTARGGAIYTKGREKIAATGEGSALFRKNVASGEVVYGGAVYVGAGCTLEVSVSGDIAFTDNDASAHSGVNAGALITNGDSVLTLHSANILFSDNIASADSGKAYGGAQSSYGSVDVQATQDIRYTGNTVVNRTGSAWGGAVVMDNGSTQSTGSMTAGENIMLSDNHAIGSTEAKGGAIYVNKSFTMAAAKNICFSGNTAESNGSSWGGAIHTTTLYSNPLVLDCSESIRFENNGAFSESGDAFGGALSVEKSSYSCHPSISHNGVVNFIGNHAESKTGAAYGGAIYAQKRVDIVGNGNVTFRKNYVKQGDTYKLSDFYGTIAPRLSAAEGGEIRFNGAVVVLNDIGLNQDYTGSDAQTHQATGSIVFSGKYTEADLIEIKGEAGTAEEILSSRASSIDGILTLNNGRLLVEEQAVLTAKRIAAQAGTTVELDNASLVSTSTSTSSSTNTLTDCSLVLTNGGALTLGGRLTLSGKVTLDVSGYALGTHTLIAANGVVGADLLDISYTEGEREVYDIVWNEKKTALTLTVTKRARTEPLTHLWTSGFEVLGDGQALGDEEFMQGDTLQFNEAAAVTISGTVKPAAIVVDTAGDVSFIDDSETPGNIAGACSLSKDGSGKLTISTANTYTGGTTLNGGTLEVANAHALGSGAVTMTGGTLAGTLSDTTIQASGGNITAELTGSNSITGANFALSSALRNSGVLSLSGSFSADNLELRHSDATHVDVNGSHGAAGFAKAAFDAVTVVNGGTVINDGATVTHGSLLLELGSDGVASRGGTVDQSEYLLVNGTAAASSAIHAKSATASVTMNGGTLTVDDAVQVTATGGALVLNGGSLSGTLNNVTLTMTRGSLNTSLGGSTSLIGNQYALTETLSNTGVLRVSGGFDASALSLKTTGITHVDVNGVSGASGFTKYGDSSVTLINGGTVVNDGALITHGNLTLALGTDGVARATGTTVYSEYLLTGSDTVTTAAVHGMSSSATITQTGGTLTVNDTATVNATAGDITLSSGTLNGTLSGTTITATNGTLVAALSGSNTLSGSNYALQRVISNSGTLTMSGSFNANAMTLNTTAATYVDVNGNSGTSGFAKDAVYSVQVVNGGTVVNNGATVTHGSHTLTLGSNGVATEGGAVDYGTYMLTGTSTATTSAIHSKSSAATVSMNGGTLTVNDTASVNATAGKITLSSGTLNGTLSGTTITATNGTIAATLTGNNTVTGSNYALREVIANNGTLTIGGTLDVSALTLNTTDATHVDVNGNSGASGFEKYGDSSVVVVNGGTVVNSNAVVKHGNLSLSLGVDGVARTTGTTLYGTYLLTGNDSVSVSAIRSKSSTATITQTGGTLTANGTASVTTTGGTIALTSGTLSGTISNADVTASSGTLKATFNGYNTLTGQSYALGSVLSNTGTLAMNGSFNASSLTLNTTAATHIDVNGNSGANGFAKDAAYSVKLVNGGTVVNSGATVTHGTRTLELGTDGYATAGGDIHYDTYLLTGSATASTGAIHSKSSAATVSMNGGTLTVNDDATVTATGGAVVLSSGTLNGTLIDAAIQANGGTLSADVSGSKTLTVGGNVNLTGCVTSSVMLNSGRLTAENGMELEAGQTLTFNGGRMTGDILTTAGSTLALNAAATLTGALTLDGGSLVLNGKTLTLTGELNLQSETAMDVSSYGIGTYKLLSFDELVGSVDNLRIDSKRYRYALAQENNALTLTVKALNNTLTWNQPKGVWTTNGNFGNGAFSEGDDVIFRSAANVTISGDVQPGSVVVDSPDKVTFTCDKKVYGSGIAGNTSVTKSGAGMLTMNAGNTYTGGTTLYAGTLKATAVDSFGEGTITVKGGTLDLGSKAVANDIVLSGEATLKGDAKYAGAVTVEGDATLLAKASYKGMTSIGVGSTLTLAPKATMAGSITIDGGTLNITAPKGMILAKNTTMLLLDGGSVSGLVTIGTGSTLVWSGGSFEAMPVLKGGTVDLGGENVLTLTGSKAQVAFGDKALQLPGKGTVRTDEALVVNSGSVTVNSMGGYEGEIAVNGGTLKLSTGKATTDNDIVVNGTAAVVNGGTHYGDITVDGLLAKGTTIKLLTDDQRVSLNGKGTLLGTISGAGIIDVNAGIDATAAKLTAATINLNSGTFTNTKGIKLAKGQTLTLAGAALNLGTKGALATVAGSTLVVDSNTTLTGSLTLSGGELVLNGTTLQLDGTLTLSKAMTVTGSGTMTYTTLKPFKGDIAALLGGAEVEWKENSLLINGGASKPLGMAAVPEDAAEEAIAPLDTAPVPMPTANPVADAMVQADWGILDAERAFMGAVNSRSQHATLLDKGRGAAWVSAFGASVRHGNQGSHHGSDGTIEGAAFGLEHAVSDTASLGLAVGRSKNRLAATGVTHLRQETAHVALYGQKQLKHGFTADAAATYGDTETKLGAASWTQKSAALSARLTHAKMLSDTTAFRTFGGLSYEATDAGSIGTVHTGSVQNLRAELGAGATHTAGKAHFYAEAALTGDMVRHNPTVDFGGARTHGANPGRLGVRATVGGIYEFTDTWSGTASYGIEAESRSTAHTLNIGVSKSF